MDQRIYVNSVTGDTFRHEAGSPGAVRLRFEIPAGGDGAPPHRHRHLRETFTVVSGRLQMTTGSASAWRTILPGETVVVEPGTVHAFRNPHDEPVVFTSEAAPALRFAWFVHAWYGLANEGRSFAGGPPRNPLALAVVLGWADFWFPVVPIIVQRGLFGPLRLLARATGVQARMERAHIPPALRGGPS